MKKQGLPSWGELVVCRIGTIHPNSATAELIEYGLSGMIHVSEVASRWVKDIREFIKENKIVVCRVMRVDKHHIELSIKRVQRGQAESKLNEYKRESKAEKMLEQAAKGMKKSLEDAYKEVGYKLIDDFGSIAKAFEFAHKNPELLKTKGVPKEWADFIIETANRQYEEKTYNVRADLNIVCYQPDGINVIKSVLTKAKSKGLEIKYISPPKYLVTVQGKKYKELESRVISACEEIVKEISKNNGEASFELAKQ